MLKYLAIATVLSSLILRCASAQAVESMTMQDGNFSLAGNAPNVSETSSITNARDDVDAVGAMREAGSMHSNESTSVVATRRRAHSDNVPRATAVRTDRAHPAVGADDAADPPARKIHNGASWQSLLPGVMK